MAQGRNPAEHQIQELQRYYPQMQAQGNNKFKIPLQLPTGVINLLLELPTEFPYRAPFVYVLDQVAHPLIGTGQLVRYPAMTSWRPSFRLSQIIYEIAQEFVRQAPLKNQSQNNQAQAQRQEQAPLPDFKRHLSQMSERELSNIQNEDGMENFLYRLPEIDSLVTERDNLLKRNMRIAGKVYLEKILEIEPQVRQKEEELRPVFQQLEQEKGELLDLQRQCLELGGVGYTQRFSKDAILEHLNLTKDQLRVRVRSLQNTALVNFESTRKELLEALEEQKLIDIIIARVSQTSQSLIQPILGFYCVVFYYLVSKI